MTAKIEKGLTVKTKNEVGALAKITKALSKAKVNMKALVAYAHGDQGIFYMIVNNQMVAKQKLGELGEVSESDVVVIEIADRVGTLNDVAEKVSAAGVDIDYCYVTADGKQALVVLATKDNAKAVEVIG
ncbi:hypothetical protein ACFL5G_04585 [Candidatus Margulisiibacteriota bacterium]